MENLTTPVDIQFSQHSLLKIELLKSHGFALSTEIIKNIIRFPDKTDKSYKDRSIAQKDWDNTHVVRVIYETSAGKILVITLYPGRRSRYEKD